ncbi:MAG: radical SAM protein [Candidatus Woesearchaeota archaeon]
MEKPILLLNVPRFLGGKDITYETITPPEYPPLNLGYLAAFLNKFDYKAEVIDLDIEKDPNTKLSELLSKKDYLLIGLTFTTPLFENAKKTATIIKQTNKSVPIVVGGVHPTISPEECISFENFDYVIEGEGEVALLKLVKNLTKNIPNLSEIGGFNYKDKGKNLRNSVREKPLDLDSLPFPRRDLFLQHKYRWPDTLKEPVMPIMTSRGCPGRCTYCCSHKICPTVRLRSAENVVNEIEWVINKYGVKEIHIWDDCFTISKKRVTEICNLIKQKKLKIKIAFPNGVRADMVDQDILKSLKEAGAYSIAFGVESGNEEILKKIKKGVTKAQYIQAFKLAKRAGLETWGFFILGLFGETESTIWDTINFAKELKPDIAKFNLLVPFPGTEIYTQLDDAGLILQKDFSKYGYHSKPVYHLETIDMNSLIRFHRQAYREFYLRPSVLLRQLLRIRSFIRLKINAHLGVDIFKLIFKR